MHCCGSGSSSPDSRFRFSSCSGLTVGTRNRLVGSPGASWTIRKISSEMPNTIGVAWMIRLMTYVAISPLRPRP